MDQHKILNYGSLTDLQKEQLIEIFIDGFGHLLTFSKDKEQLKELYKNAFNPDYTLAYIEDGSVLGMIGIATNVMRPLKLLQEDCIKCFGKFKGNMVCKQMNSISQGQVIKGDKDLYIDILATSKSARNKGIATKLLKYCFELPEYNSYYIEVLSKNSNAKKLYEKMGFIQYKKELFSPISLIGYGYPIKMKR